MPDLAKTGVCRLCLEVRTLRHSHVVPAFVFRWLMETSATGFARLSQSPNKRSQDGWKRWWLCGTCEGALATLEKEFAEKLFTLLVDERPVPYTYGPWLAPFLASVLWRAVMALAEGAGAFDVLTPEQTRLMSACQERWRAFTAGKAADPGIHELHLLPLGLMAAYSGDPKSLAPNLNRYLMRAVDIHIAGTRTRAFILAKMGPAVALGFIQPPPPDEWQGTRIKQTGGVIQGRMVLPTAFLDYLNERAHRVRETLLDNVSPRQRAVIEKTLLRDLARADTSGTMRALDADVQAFGADRVWPTSDSLTKPPEPPNSA